MFSKHPQNPKRCIRWGSTYGVGRIRDVVWLWGAWNPVGSGRKSSPFPAERKPTCRILRVRLAVRFRPHFLFHWRYTSLSRKSRNRICYWMGNRIMFFFLFWYRKTTIYYVIKDYRVTDNDRLWWLTSGYLGGGRYKHWRLPGGIDERHKWSLDSVAQWWPLVATAKRALGKSKRLLSI